MRVVRILALAFLAGAILPVPALAKDDIVIVEVEGEGISEEQALKVALRAALEEGGKQEIFAETKVENYQVMHDTIISRAQGIVTDFEILEKKKIVGGTFKVRIKAKVSKSVLAKHWGEIQNVLNQIGRPKVLVWINESIDNVLQDSSQLEVLIEKPFIKSGFDMVSRQAIDTLKQKELTDAASTGDTGRLQSIAKQLDAHIFIAGAAHANPAGVRTVYGEPLAMYNCDAQIKVYYTDNAKLLASEGIPNDQIEGRGGVRGELTHSPQAGRKAFANIAQPMVDSLYQQVMEQWATQISAGGELILEVQGLSAVAALKLKKKLADIEGVEHVNTDKSRELMKYRIVAKAMSAEQLAEHLIEDEFAAVIEITDWNLNRIQAKAVD